ncbi:hypothetical protein SAMN02927900_01614 [Rhizobium mongolense subsp. loessense]|uniref:Uncharacterized protein n=1 Tax=Rhizobium mongolense subsp. loessense TaxID=158890 RepID=A0A1G4QMP3_9HYPH|nr:hypothetical protein SAMN02927900_01614 [Rhizobium mongolense subsp. loessense]
MRWPSALQNTALPSTQPATYQRPDNMMALQSFDLNLVTFNPTKMG